MDPVGVLFISLHVLFRNDVGSRTKTRRGSDSNNMLLEIGSSRSEIAIHELLASFAAAVVLSVCNEAFGTSTDPLSALGSEILRLELPCIPNNWGK